MALTEQIPTPFLAFVGAGDLAVEKIRGAKLDVDVKSVQAQVQTAANTRVAELRAAADQTVADVRALPEKAQAVALEQLQVAGSVYSELASRGEDLVARIRGQKATQDLSQTAQTTAASAKATATTAKRSAKATSTRAKATRTSAKKAASAAQKATADGADKVGN